MVGRPLLALSSPSPPSSPRHSTQSKIPIPITYKSEYYLTAYLASHFLEPRASSSSPRARADRDVPKKNGVLALPRPRARPKDTARNGRNLIGTSQVATCPTPHSDGGRTAAQPSAAAEAAADAADADDDDSAGAAPPSPLLLSSLLSRASSSSRPLWRQQRRQARRPAPSMVLRGFIRRTDQPRASSAAPPPFRPWRAPPRGDARRRRVFLALPLLPLVRGRNRALC